MPIFHITLKSENHRVYLMYKGAKTQILVLFYSTNFNKHKLADSFICAYFVSHFN